MSGRIPARLLRKPAAAPSPRPTVMERRVERAARASEERAGLVDAVRQALVGTGVAEESHEAVARVVGEISDAWRTALDEMVETGRRLIELQGLAGSLGYTRLYRAGLVPVEPSRASKLRAIAAAVDSRVIPAEAMPQRFASAYYAASRPPKVVGAMLAEGVLRTDATLRELTEFAARVSPPEPDGSGEGGGEEAGGIDASTRRRLLRQLQTHETKAARLRALLGIDPA